MPDPPEYITRIVVTVRHSGPELTEEQGDSVVNLTVQQASDEIEVSGHTILEAGGVIENVPQNRTE